MGPSGQRLGACDWWVLVSVWGCGPGQSVREGSVFSGQAWWAAWHLGENVASGRFRPAVHGGERRLGRDLGWSSLGHSFSAGSRPVFTMSQINGGGKATPESLISSISLVLTRSLPGAAPPAVRRCDTGAVYASLSCLALLEGCCFHRRAEDALGCGRLWFWSVSPPWILSLLYLLLVSSGSRRCWVHRPLGKGCEDEGVGGAYTV